MNQMADRHNDCMHDGTMVNRSMVHHSIWKIFRGYGVLVVTDGLTNRYLQLMHYPKVELTEIFVSNIFN